MARDRQNGAPEALNIGAPLYHQMIEHVRSVAPIEGVGLIAFSGSRAVKIYPGTNTEQSTTRYNMDPAEVIAALNEIDRQGWYLGAIFHSHPRSEATPSPTDLRHAYYPDALMVIISLLTDPPTVRAFRVDGEVREVPVRVLPEEGTAATA
ncbi:M67 family metallopeptidase [Sphaerobacter thermophilus]|uniref:JAB domain-containing protein n=1 Tax=Sphaerobacter thermophilus (strain ATCC 49802 / DSM 20745 / KCCM 41009 / NCIMB 13125 / S 6022) TaxID=479434 RepID=D1C1K5_SPHTD|nr:M67 family metallopeptidase [Sphaerobacter thermophilus]ACZ38122.1 conserved hypothetical protein [Sphaerobacter thermophilus DSM 20745]